MLSRAVHSEADGVSEPTVKRVWSKGVLECLDKRRGRSMASRAKVTDAVTDLVLAQHGQRNKSYRVCRLVGALIAHDLRFFS